MAMAFQKAVRKRAKLRLGLGGPSGAGKSFSALLLAKGLGGRIAVIDTEHGSASMYSHLVDFDTLELTPPYSPERYIEAVKLAEANGYDVCIIDSSTHEWSGSGGVLELVDTVAKARYKGNSWSAWNDLTPRHRAFIDCMLQSPMHIICTARSKTETAQVEENGRKTVKKLGMKLEQRDGIEYEFTLMLELEHDRHYAIATKDRTGLFTEPHVITEATGKRLLQWLDSGAEVKPQQSVDPVKVNEVVAQFMAALEADFEGATTEEESERMRAQAIYGIRQSIAADNEMLLAVWDRLKDQPTARSAIKKYTEMAKKEAA